MTTYTIIAIQVKAERTGWGQDYIDDCRALATEWGDTEATFTKEALDEIRSTWNENGKPAKTKTAPCKTCGGL